jgi:uncharacterized protein (DUF608 family)
MKNDREPCECNTPDACGGNGIPRRDFLKIAGASVTGLALSGVKDFTPPRWLVPADPQLSKEWKQALFARGARTFYRDKDLRFIGMPVGGICTGQVYLGGDGRLWLWDVFNVIKLGSISKSVTYREGTHNPMGGANYIEPPEQVHPFSQGFAIKIGDKVRTLDKEGWSDVAFAGEYPVGIVEYRDPASPVRVTLEAFSPFIPLDADDSGLPATIMRYTVHNDGKEAVQVSLGGWLENAVGRNTVEPGEGIRTNTALGNQAVEMGIKLPARPPRENRPPILFEDFETSTYGAWTVEGTAFGPGPRERSKIAAYQGDVGGKGLRVVNTHNTLNGEDSVKADNHVGKLTSPEFTISRRFIEFYIGGGNHPQRTCVNLLVDGKAVRTTVGPESNQMRLAHFNVEELEGKRARIEVVDQERGGWGQIAIDHIQFVDEPTQLPLNDRADVGTMALGLLEGGAGRVVRSVPETGTAQALFLPTPPPAGGARPVEGPTPARLLSGVTTTVTVQPGKSAVVSFAVAWHFPNLTINQVGKVGHHYATRFKSAGAVLDYLNQHRDRLIGLTKRWHETWYDSTLPRWFLDRSMMPTSILASMTCVRFANGRFYGWEGVGCCDGTCGHVWQYAQSVGRLFPSLERSVREMCDFKVGVGFHPDSGLIDFRGEYGFGYAADAQAGYVLRAYREHQMSKDDAFLRRVWPQAKRALEYLIEQDMDDDGVLEGRQHNTLDVDLYGPSSWLTSLYLAALQSGARMAAEMGDRTFQTRCETLFNAGTARFDKLFWNGEYYVQRLITREHPEALRYGNGCEIDQVMGQGWAMQLGLRRVTDPAKTRQALKALYQYNFRTTMGPYRDKYKPGRWYAMPDEAGLLLCTFPKGDRDKMLGPQPTWAHMYFNECWTGCEYEAAGHMVFEGLVEEGLAVMKALDERYHPSRRNPYNEVECSDHYARAMASYGVYTAAMGFEYHGPKGMIGFAPRLNPKDFRGAFTGAEGWGTYSQSLKENKFEAKILVRHGQLKLKAITLEIPKGAQRPAVFLNGRRVAATVTVSGTRFTFTLAHTLTLREGEDLEFV